MPRAAAFFSRLLASKRMQTSPLSPGFDPHHISNNPLAALDLALRAHFEHPPELV